VAWLTDAGLAAAISADYRSPIERLRAELARKDQAIDEIRALTDSTLDQPSITIGRAALIASDALLNISRVLSDLSEHQEGDSNG
jgi:hypothetical protein